MNKIDKDFYKLIDYLKNTSKEELIDVSINRYKGYTQEYRTEFEKEANNTLGIMRFGKISEKENDYTLIKNRVSTLLGGLRGIEDFYDLLEDYRSKKTLMIILYNLVNFNPKILDVVKEKLFNEYFDMDIIDTDRIGVYVFKILQSNVKKYGDYVEIRNVGLGRGYETKFVKEEWNIVGNHLGDEGDYKVSIVPLDGDIKEKVAVIKLDVEGSEYEALSGAENIIKRDKPQLIVCLYHNLEDIYVLPQLIHEFRPDYKFYLRYYGDCLRPLDYVLYAI